MNRTYSPSNSRLSETALTTPAAAYHSNGDDVQEHKQRDENGRLQAEALRHELRPDEHCACALRGSLYSR